MSRTTLTTIGRRTYRMRMSISQQVQASIAQKQGALRLQEQQTWPMRFTVRGCPVAYVRQTQRDRWQLRPAVVRYRQWRDDIRASAGFPEKQRVTRAMRVTVKAWMPMPLRWGADARRRIASSPHLSTPDADNLLKAVLDAIFEDDSVVYAVACEKQWDDGHGPRLEVTLE